MARLEVEEVVSVEQVEGLLPLYVSRSGIWVGALSAFALLLVFGLTGIAVTPTSSASASPAGMSAISSTTRPWRSSANC